MNGKTWTEHQDKELVRLWATHSASQIAEKIGKTRGAVIGRYHRLEGRYAEYVRPGGIESRAAAAKRRKEKAALNERLTSAIKTAVSKLADRNTMILWAIDKGASQAAIANALGVTRQRINQIHTRRE